MPGRPCIKRGGPLLPAAQWVNLREVILQPGAAPEEARFQALMEAHHYLGALPKIGHTLWYIATWHGQWLALLSFSAAAWKCAARDAWIGWDFRHAYDRLHLIANNSRLLILPEHHYPNLASRVLAGCERRLAADWRARFGYPLLLLETLVDPRLFHGTLYHAANWRYVGNTRGFRRTRAPPRAPRRPSASLSDPCTSTPKPGCRVPSSTPSIVTEPPRSC